MNTIRWNVAVSANTDQSLRMFLASQGGSRKGDLSRFIEEAVRARILELTAGQSKAANVDAERLRGAILHSKTDRAAALQEPHETDELKRVLDKCLLEANDSGTKWLSHEEVFANLEARYAD
jgi:hypothetical protein